jgi:hypothetical protein
MNQAFLRRHGSGVPAPRGFLNRNVCNRASPQPRAQEWFDLGRGAFSGGGVLEVLHQFQLSKTEPVTTLRRGFLRHARDDSGHRKCSNHGH